MTVTEGFGLVVFDLGGLLGVLVYRLVPDHMNALVDRLMRLPLVPYRGRHRARPAHSLARHAAPPELTWRDIPRASVGSSPTHSRRVTPIPADDYARPLVVGRDSGRHAA